MWDNWRTWCDYPQGIPVQTSADVALNLYPVTLDEAKEECDVPGDDTADVRIGRLIRQATQAVQSDARIVLIPITWRMPLDRFPVGKIELRKCPVVSAAVKYVLNTVTTTWATTNYDLDVMTIPARISPKVGYYWPTPDLGMNKVLIEWVSGPTSPATVKEEVKGPILCQIRKLWYGDEPGCGYWSMINRIKQLGYVD